MGFNIVELGGHLRRTVDYEFGAFGTRWCLGVDGVGVDHPHKDPIFVEKLFSEEFF